MVLLWVQPDFKRDASMVFVYIILQRPETKIVREEKNDRFDREDRNTLLATLSSTSYRFQHGTVLTFSPNER